jgi:hypothetical protein
MMLHCVLGSASSGTSWFSFVYNTHPHLAHTVVSIEKPGGQNQGCSTQGRRLGCFNTHGGKCRSSRSIS